MGRHKKVVMDQLTIDSTNAIKAGMSYGKYMAMKNPTKITKPALSGYKYICHHCGKEFYAKVKGIHKYCSVECREAFYSKSRPNGPVLKTCLTCGKEFMSKTYQNKYCSVFCRRVAQNEQAKAYQKRKALKALEVDHGEV